MIPFPSPFSPPSSNLVKKIAHWANVPEFPLVLYAPYFLGLSSSGFKQAIAGAEYLS